MIAFVDESARPGPEGLCYVVAAAVVFRADVDRARAEVRKILFPGESRFHWSQTTHARRQAMVDLITELDLMAFIRWCYPTPLRRQEQARAACLRALATDLAREGVNEMVLERRQQRLDHRDLSTLLATKKAALIPEEFVYRFDVAVAEPLLWPSDAIAGALTFHLTQKTSEFYERLVIGVLDLRRVEP